MKKNNFIILVAGFAIFSMFFGSGNLVFPLQIGVESLNHHLYASVGLFLTGIMIPFLGLFSVLVKGTPGNQVLMRIGKVPGLVLIFMMLSLMGPFGVGARCILVAYGGMQLVFPQLSLFWFSILFCFVTGYIIWRRHGFVDIIGRFLTPVLLVGIGLIILFGLLLGGQTPTSEVPKVESFWTGINYGYQTMDLLAAFFFSSTALGYLKFAHQGKESKKDLINAGLLACTIGISLLTIVYIGFVILGAKYAPYLITVSPEQMLTQIAGRALGVFAMPVMALTVMLACLTTLIVLTNLFSEFFHDYIVRKKVDLHWSIVTTLGITFCVSLFGFKALAVWIGEALSIAYPALIALALASIVKDLLSLNNRVVQAAFYLTLAVSIAYNFI